MQIIGHFFALLPGLILTILVLTDSLSANPIQTATSVTGKTAVSFILASLFCSPLKNFFKMSVFLWIRKIFGLHGFYYSFAHFILFVGVDYQFNSDWLIPELLGKPFLQIGIAALLFLFLLAVTSMERIKKALGSAWKKLHRLIYVITVIIIIHVTMASKGDLFDPLLFTAFFILAMALRLPILKKISIRKLPEWAQKPNTYLIQNIYAV